MRTPEYKCRGMIRMTLWAPDAETKNFAIFTGQNRPSAKISLKFHQTLVSPPKIVLNSGFIQKFLLQHVANGNIYIKSLKHLGTLPLDPTQILQIPPDGDAPFAIQTGVLHRTKSARRGPKSQNFAGRRSCLGTYIRGS